MEKTFAKTLLGLYLLILIWLVLFKFSINFAMFFHPHNQTGLNLIPFAASAGIGGGTNFKEIIFNCLFFIPLGVLLGINFKGTAFAWKLAWVCMFSVAAETLQYVFAIGASDITDVITNTLGGFIGLAAYVQCRKFISNKILDKAILSLGAVMFLLFAMQVSQMIFRRMLQ